MDSKINGVGASAAALANLQYDDYQGQKWQMAAGIGNYQNKTATALGVKVHLSDNVSAHVDATVGANENMVGGGFSIAFGPGHTKGLSASDHAEIEALKQDNQRMHQDIITLATALKNISFIDESRKLGFSDVPEDHWASDAVDTLHGNGLVDGYSDGEYKGERQLTRYEYAQMLYKALLQGEYISGEILREYSSELHDIQDHDPDYNTPLKSVSAAFDNL